MLHEYTIQCGAVITQSIFYKILKIDAPFFARDGEVWVTFVSVNTGICSTSVTVVLYALSYDIVPRYNGTRPYFSCDTYVTAE